MNYMDYALKESNKCYKYNDVPVGCVIVFDNKIIAKAHNMKEKYHSSIYHAEIIAIKKACRKLKCKNLSGCSLYVTLEPCKMCYYAIAESKIDNVFYIVDSLYNKSIINKKNKIHLNKIDDQYNYLDSLKLFFKKMR